MAMIPYTFKRVAWCSQHPLSQEQEESLVNKLGGNVQTRQNPDGGWGVELVEYAVLQRNITWQATTDEVDDNVHNFGVWSDLHDEFDVIAGVFPAVALASRLEYSGPIYAPVKLQDGVRELDCPKRDEYRHAYWVEID